MRSSLVVLTTIYLLVVYLPISLTHVCDVYTSSSERTIVDMNNKTNYTTTKRTSVRERPASLLWYLVDHIKLYIPSPLFHFPQTTFNKAVGTSYRDDIKQTNTRTSFPCHLHGIHQLHWWRRFFRRVVISGNVQCYKWHSTIVALKHIQETYTRVLKQDSFIPLTIALYRCSSVDISQD